MKQSLPFESERQQKGHFRSTVSNASPASQTFVDNRESAAIQRQLMAKMANSPQAIAQRKFSEKIHNSPQMLLQRQQMAKVSSGVVQQVEGEEELLQGRFKTLQRVEEEELMQGKFGVAQRVEEEELMQGKFASIQRVEEEELLQGKFDIAQRVEEEELMQGQFKTVQLAEEPVEKQNNTGLPDNLKHGIENLSGMSMDYVKVHYNSSKPAQLNALAYAQGTDIHLGAGQEKHLPHEAWHVVQQAQGRVKPTMQMREGVPVNDDQALEHEADVMGAKAVAGVVQAMKESGDSIGSNPTISSIQPIQLFEWGSSTPLKTIMDFFSAPSWEGAKDVVDPRRARLNPLNIIEGYRNYGEETAGGNYHSSSKHGAHNTVSNAMNRLTAPSTMQDKYAGGGATVNHANTQGRFNSEAWESFSWRKAKENFEADIGVPVTWVPGAFPAVARSTWQVCLNHVGSDVGLSQSVGAAINSVSGVRVAINYRLHGGGPGVEAYNGQMFPTNPVAPVPGHVRAVLVTNCKNKAFYL